MKKTGCRPGEHRSSKGACIPYNQATGELPKVVLKTKLITFDDRLQQVRIIEKTSTGYDGPMRFLNYRDDDGFFYVKKYRPNDWIHVIKV